MLACLDFQCDIVQGRCGFAWICVTDIFKSNGIYLFNWLIADRWKLIADHRRIQYFINPFCSGCSRHACVETGTEHSQWQIELGSKDENEKRFLELHFGI